MIPFLQSVARGYHSHYAQLQGGNPDLSRFCFIFPNKRAGTFFLKYLNAVYETDAVAPHVTTVSDFVSQVSGLEVGQRLDLLIRLYKSYVSLVAPGVPQEQLPDSLRFEAFRMWGEIVLRDFSEVDMQNVPAEEIFRNLRDYRSISTDFLTEEQRVVMEEYFGRSLYASAESFWKKFDSFDPEKSPGSPRARFLQIWQVLGPLYRSFNKSLEADRLATTGGVYLNAMRILRERGMEILPYDKVVFVGFNALSVSERGIFSALRRSESRYSRLTGDTPADFVWDATGPVLADSDNPAGRYVAVNRREYPEPDWLRPFLKLSDTSALPAHLEMIASPSNVMQCKIAGEEIYKCFHNLGKEAFEDARVAIVLPDEDLLMPMLYSLPSEIGSPNLTMGVPLKTTSLSTFMALLRHLQMTRRRSRGEEGFAVADLVHLLAHPISHALFRTGGIRRFRRELQERRRIVVRESELTSLSPNAAIVLRAVDMKGGWREAYRYMSDVLRAVAETLSGDNGVMVKNRMETVHATAWHRALQRLADTIGQHGVNLTAATFFFEAERLIGAEIEPFEGEPLKGLQIMGLLETRSLDFDHIVIPSMNDSILPMRQRQRTFLPETLRRGFGMPPANYQENIFAYYFYRLISRAGSVTMIYDSRIGISGGGPSRYLRQLEYLHAPGHLKHSDRRFEITTVTAQREATRKDSGALARLARFRTSAEKPKCFSASSLKKYCICQMKFFLETVCGLRSDMKPADHIDRIEMGQIYHRIMQRIYMPGCEVPEHRFLPAPVRVTAGHIDRLLQSADMIDNLIRRDINENFRKHDGNTADSELLPADLFEAIVLRELVLQTLRRERDIAPFDIVGCEVAGGLPFRVDDNLSVMMTYVIDRIDRVADGFDAEGNPLTHYRIVDYKTGAVWPETDSMQEIFTKLTYSNPSFQMMLYAELLGESQEWKERFGNPDVEMVVYQVSDMRRNGIVAAPVIAGETVRGYREVREEFRARLRQMLKEIYDPNLPFEPVENRDECRFCDFASLCNRRARN